MSLRSVFRKFGTSNEILKVEGLLLVERYDVKYIERLTGKHDPWILHLKTDSGLQRYFAPNGIKNLLEKIVEKEAGVIKVEGYFKLLSRNENGCKGFIDFSEKTLERIMKSELKGADYDVSNVNVISASLGFAAR
jgi:hypothetical protein